jgi:hypothetical protein
MRLLIAALTALVLALASCGGDDDGGSDNGGSDGAAAVSDEDQITEVVETFAESGSEACDLITDEYVKELFGGRDQCLEQAEEGGGSDPEVDNIEVTGDTATADGTVDGDTITFTLEKDGEDWKISGIEEEE